MPPDSHWAILVSVAALGIPPAGSATGAGVALGAANRAVRPAWAERSAASRAWAWAAACCRAASWAIITESRCRASTSTVRRCATTASVRRRRAIATPRSVRAVWRCSTSATRASRMRAWVVRRVWMMFASWRPMRSRLCTPSKASLMPPEVSRICTKSGWSWR